MKMSRRWIFTVSLVSTLAFSALGVSTSWAGEPPYLTSKQLDLTRILPTPIANDTPEAKAEEQIVIAAQKAASPERIALANADAKETVFDMFTRTLGPAFVAENMPKATIFFARVGESEDETVDPIKKVYGRTRPYLANPEIKALVPASKSGSYPSGHTTRVNMMAIILGDMIPEKRPLLWARTTEYAESRIIGGMHYPNDLEGGKRAGTAMAITMFADPAFRADFDVAKAEVRKALGL